MNLPEPQEVRVEQKRFYFDVGNNNRGVFLRLSEVCKIVVGGFLFQMVNHYDFVALHSMWRIFLKGICVLVRVEIVHKSKFLPGAVEKNSSTIRSFGRNRTYAYANRATGIA